jgi:hypothetical protein
MNRTPSGQYLARAWVYHPSVQLKFQLTCLPGLLCAIAPVLLPQRGFAATGRYVILGGADHRFSWFARKNDRRQKAIVCPTRNLRSAQRYQSLVPQGTPPADEPERDKDIQTIYSWLITHSTAQDKLYLIAPETQQSDYPPERCLEIPPDNTAAFREIRADFDRRKDTTRKVPKSLSTPKPYVILDPNAAKELLKSALLTDSPLIRERFPGALHLWLFSDVRFNQKRTVALVQVYSWCGGLCGLSYWIAFEKGNEGVWQMRPWARACVAVA